MDKEKLKSDILNLILERGEGGVTFANLVNEIDGIKGDREWGILDYNWIVWSGISIEAIQCLNELQSEKKIYKKTTSVLVYAADGTILRLPVVEKKIKYKEPHWIPIIYLPVGVL